MIIKTKRECLKKIELSTSRRLIVPPKMFLECTGSDGFHPDNSSSISIQTAFFRKHGFRVENRKHYPRYLTMVRPEGILKTKIVYDFTFLAIYSQLN